MRVTVTTGDLKVQAISGTYVVVLGFNLPEDKCDGLLGFSIHRVDHAGNVSRFLEGMKAFAETDPGFPPGSLYSTKDHPVQGFQWADYAAAPGLLYTYTVTALKGTPANLVAFAATSVEITTESPENGDHDVYFNRGTAASQEYIRRFGDRPPDTPAIKKQAFEWLSRGLFEAMCLFVSSCVPGKHALRIAAYEFHYKEFLDLISQVSDNGNGVDIQIVYDDRGDKPGKKNEEEIGLAGIGDICKPRKEGKSFISHNKFIVKLENGQPQSVWTGGTNFSDGGIFGHSNVAHVIEDAAIAAKYMEYWTALHGDPVTPSLRDTTEQITAIPAAPPPAGSSALFSPRNSLDALNYYAQLAMQATEGLFMTFAFGMNNVFKDVYRNSAAPFRLALMEKKTRPLKKGSPEEIAELQAIQDLRNMPENVFAVGNFIRTNKFDGWVKERLTGLNTNVQFVHNKFMLVDPLGEDPVVVSGSANFSNASTTDNDENMVVIRGNKRVADIYLGEYMRLFSHFSFRESLEFRELDEPPKPLSTGDWWKDSFGNTPRSSRRKYFASVSI